MNTQLIVEPGSCHGNSLELCQRYVDLCQKNDLRYLKFQLFPLDITSPNIYLSNGTFEKTLEYAKTKFPELTVFASVWGPQKLGYLKELGIKTVKFAHSQRNNMGDAYKAFDTVFVSLDYLDPYPEQENVIPMFCDPSYPVKYLLDLDGIFKKFHSISDHTIGLHQTLMIIRYHPAYIEKHVAIDNAVECPDKRFSITENECSHLQQCIRSDIWMS